MKKAINTLIFAFVVALTITAQDGFQVGDLASDFSLLGTDDKVHSLESINADNGYIVIFTCNHCPYAVMYEDRIVALQNEFGPKGYQVVAINPNDPELKPADSFENMKVRAQEKGFNFPYLFDDGQKIYPLWGATKTPHVYLLDKQKTVRYIGAIDDSARDEAGVEVKYLANAINAIESGNDPDPTVTKAIGCSIKAKK